MACRWRDTFCGDQEYRLSLGTRFWISPVKFPVAFLTTRIWAAPSFHSIVRWKNRKSLNCTCLLHPQKLGEVRIFGNVRRPIITLYSFVDEVDSLWGLRRVNLVLLSGHIRFEYTLEGERFTSVWMNIESGLGTPLPTSKRIVPVHMGNISKDNTEGLWLITLSAREWE